MNKTLYLLVLLFLFPSISSAGSISLEWDLYQQSSIPAKQLIIYRAESGNELRPYFRIKNLNRTSAIDKHVKPNVTYCYEIFAEGKENILSEPSEITCVRALR